MRYVMARFKQEDREHAYRIYVTDSLKAYLGIEMRYANLWDKVDERKPEEIILNIKNKLKELE